MKQYQYNYSYLEKWMEANPHITNREIMLSFTGNINNNNSLALYAQRKTPMPIINLLRFCNTFGVPISAFIVEKGNNNGDDSDECTMRVEPSVNDQMEPDGGYISVGERRHHGSRALRNPLEVDHIKSTVPGLVIAKTQRQEIQTGGIRQSATATHSTIHQTATTSPLPSSGDNESNHADGSASSVGFSTLNRMLDIIAEQQKQIAEQQKLIAELTRRMNTTTGFMAAEDIHH